MLVFLDGAGADARLRAALLAGEVSWAVVRRIVALATPETEATCLETVRGLPLPTFTAIAITFASTTTRVC